MSETTGKRVTVGGREVEIETVLALAGDASPADVLPDLVRVAWKFFRSEAVALRFAEKLSRFGIVRIFAFPGSDAYRPSIHVGIAYNGGFYGAKDAGVWPTRKPSLEHRRIEARAASRRAESGS